MRPVPLLALAFLVIGMACAPAQAADLAGWELVWSDEFTGPSLDLSKWEFEVNANGGGNKELQYYVTNNVRVKDGMLNIEARHEQYTGPGGTREYTSSRLRTRRKGDWRYGRLDIRARLPGGRGLWPAIWLLPTDEKYGAWPHSGEIDIMELLGHEPNKVHGTLHYSDRTGRHRSRGTNTVLAAGSFADDFHVFRLDWDPGAMRWYVDDRLYQTQTNWTRRSADFPAPFDQRFHLILNVAVGGNWPGNPDAATSFPQTMTVDYVRIYRRR
ncbi:MAG TPA: glycoside hydrolase family 16 protein [Verrucomicrobiae bacterium]|nr:glycoside hydrolase family 16 protein [Verrucomicrobiae bacterium]